MEYLKVGSYLTTIFFLLFLFFFWSNKNRLNIIAKFLILFLFLVGLLTFPTEEFSLINYMIASLSILFKFIFSFASNIKAKHRLILILLVGIDCLFFIV